MYKRAFDDEIRGFANDLNLGPEFGQFTSKQQEIQHNFDNWKADKLDEIKLKFKEGSDEAQAMIEKIEALGQKIAEMPAPDLAPQSATDTVGQLRAFTEKEYGEMYIGIGNLRQGDFERAKNDATLQTKLMMTMGSEVLSKAAASNKKAFMMKKAIDAGLAVTSAFMAANSAMEWGGKMGGAPGAAAASAMVLGLGLANAAMILAQPFPNVQGQAHDGINFIPNEGTWNLAKGERVVGAALNRDLTNFINQQPQQSRTSTINAPLTIQGNVYDEGWFSTAVQRHGEQIVRISEEYKSERGY